MDLVDELDAENSGWSTEPATITVVNHSNQAVNAAFTFADTVDGVTLVSKFTATEGVVNDAITSITLDSAATNNQAVSETVYFYVIGGELPANHVAGDTIGNITITIGVEECDYSSPLDDLLKRADEKLYMGKNSGRNKVVV